MEVLGLVDIPLSVHLLVLMALLVYLYQTWHFNTWKALGIDGPTPRFVLGNIPADMHADFLKVMQKWKNQYGKNYGMFLFRDPLFVTSDPDVIKEICIKQFNSFADRYSGVTRLMCAFSCKMLFNSEGGAWRRYRHIMTPAFTSGKLKALQGYIVGCSAILSEVLKNKATKQEDIDVKDVYQRFTMDIIAGTGFGLDTRLQTEGEDTHDIVRAMRGFFSNLSNRVMVLLAVSFPFTAPPLRALGFTMFPQRDLNFFRQCITSIIRHRDQNPQEAKTRVDFLQQMMDVRVAPGEDITDLDIVPEGSKTNKKLTEEEVLAQGIQVFNAGFETTASTLRFLSYNLATHPQVQEQLHQEIMEVVGEGEVQYEHLQKLKYMECVILETLRMYPILPSLSRQAAEPLEVKGFPIPKGMGVLLDVYTATHDPDIYPHPDTFMPDRFAESKDTLMASLPFGVGPRQCIGMRLAMQELKTALAYVCRAVRFVPCDKTLTTVEFEASALLSPKHPIIVRAEVRT